MLGGIVGIADRRRSSLSRSERPPCRTMSITRFDVATFSKSGVWDKVPEGSTLIFRRYPNFLSKQCRTDGRKLPYRKKPSLIRSAVLTEHRLVTDTDTDGHRATASSRSGIRLTSGTD